MDRMHSFGKSPKAKKGKFNRKLKFNKATKFCLPFCRTGHCKRGAKCPFTHETAKIAICKKFLQGRCKSANCLLSHATTPDKMPDCAFFLKGFCKEENCKYRHVKVNADATLCKEFQTGFCSKGAECDKSHKYLCKSFQKTGNCPKGHRCTLAHQTLSDTKFANNSDISKFKKINSKSDTATQEKISEETSVPSNNRELLNKLLTKRLRRNSEDNKQIVSQPNSEIDSSTQYIALSTEGAPRSSDDFSLAEQMLQKKARDTNCKSMGSASNQPLKRKYFVTDNDDEKLSDYLTFTGNSTRSRENDCRPTLKIIPDFLFLNK